MLHVTNSTLGVKLSHSSKVVYASVDLLWVVVVGYIIAYTQVHLLVITLGCEDVHCMYAHEDLLTKHIRILQVGVQ